MTLSNLFGVDLSPQAISSCHNVHQALVESETTEGYWRVGLEDAGAGVSWMGRFGKRRM